MKNKKGFTLIEMLAVVIILGILLLLAVPAVGGYLKKGTTEYYNSLEESIKLAAKDYTTEYRQLLPKVIGNVTIIDLSELTDNDYISNVVDSKGNSCSATVAVEKTSKNEYDYHVCLTCEKSDQTLCDSEKWNLDYSEDNNVTVDSKNYRIIVLSEGYEFDEDGNYIVDQGKEFTLPTAYAYKDNELVNDNVTPNPKSIDTNKLGSITVVYNYKGAKKEITVKVVDRVNPEAPQVVLRKNNKTGNIYNSEWFNGDVYQEFLSTDYSKEGVEGSGIVKYEVGAEDGNYIELSGNNITSTENGEYTYYVRSIDDNSNVSDINTYTVRIDKEYPSCEFEVTDGTLGANNWYTSDITIGLNVTENVSGIEIQNIIAYDVTTNKIITDGFEINEKVDKVIINKNTKGIKLIGTVTDMAGNSSSCSIQVKRDATTPTIYSDSSIHKVRYQSSQLFINLFHYSFDVSGGSTVCYLVNNNQRTSEIVNNNTLSLGVYTVECSATSNAGLTNSSTVTIRHYYSGSPYCTNGTYQNGTCHFSSNRSICGYTCHYGCDSCWDSCKTGNPSQCQAGYDQGSCNSWGESTSVWCGQGGCHNGIGALCDSYGCAYGDSVITKTKYCKGYAQIYNSCKTRVNTCQGGYYDCNCSSCYSETDNDCDRSEYLRYACPWGGYVSGTNCQL